MNRALSFIAAALLLAIAGSSCKQEQIKQKQTKQEQNKEEQKLVDLEKLMPGLVLDVRYATTNNFTGKQLYPVAKCYLRTPAAENLKLVQQDLHGMGYALKIFDAYRPLSVQKKMWEVYPHEGFVANPAKGSRHNRGAAVDLTLIKLDGTAVAMPTEYDDFTERAHRRYMDLPEDVINNRKLLTDVMRKHGFHGLPTEWWHFDFQNSEQYEILDIDYSAIDKAR